MSTPAKHPTFETAARWVRLTIEVALTIAAILFCLCLAGLAADIFMRYAFSSSIPGMQEIVNLLFDWVFMLGIAALYARNGDAAITFVVAVLPLRLQMAVALLVDLLIAAGMLVIFVQTMNLIYAQAHVLSAGLGIPEPFRFAPLAIASAVTCLTRLVYAWARILWMRDGVRPVIVYDSDI